MISVCGYIGAVIGWKALENAGDILDKIGETLFGGRYKAIYEDVASKLRAHTGAVPANHDLEHAIRLSELTSSLVMVRMYVDTQEADQLRLGGRPPERRARIQFASAARRYLHKQIGLGGPFKLESNKDVVDEIETNLDGALSARDFAAVQASLDAACKRVLRDLIAGTEQGKDQLAVPADFASFFRGKATDDEPGWALIFLAFMREALKQNHKAEVAFIASRLGYLRNSLPKLEAKFDQFLQIANSIKNDTSNIKDDISKILEIVQRRESYVIGGIQFEFPIKIEIAINDRGELIIFHSRPFNDDLSKLEFNMDENRLSLIMIKGFSCNIPIRSELSVFMRKSTQALMVLVNEEGGNLVEGDYVPLHVMKRYLEPLSCG
ncbi:MULTISPECIES: hypothetical protein [unclassified Mesorhizobium]|uniref:hypothetical protein n=1 Tax=unclassified Mesorhizobium TaxID=325217 RepID=UPI00112D03B2|nr:MULTISPECIES: hypothetical protein [unclassified Mesorhizobium]MBZ9985334.1 hypothetical protein [Mesorhizobium sp. BR-1-1-8]TPL25829.1 hypothetical protein FJ947_30170 [Mesorhizobium sp. B2-4-8]TPL58006.1 hypothetical protein FJ949_29870 [Mesorhizobium sp. B2-4-1]